MVAVVAVAAATGVGSVMYWQSIQDDDGIPAASGDNVIELTAPTEFGPQLVDSGWEPSSIGLKGDASSGLLLASEVNLWSDLNADVDGVFVGLSPDQELPVRVQAIEHDGCQNDGTKDYTDSRWTGQIRTWSNCSGGGRTVQEIHLKPASGSADTYVYVQIRQFGETEPAERVLENLRINS